MKGATIRIASGSIDTASLESLSHDELLSLTRRLVRARAGGGSHPFRRPRIDVDEVASSVASSFRDGWEPPARVVSRNISSHTDRARHDVDGKRWEDAARSALGVIRGFTEGYDPDVDPEGDVTYDLHQAMDVVDKAMSHVTSSKLRDGILDGRMELWWADLGHGGIGLSDNVPEVLRRRASREEKARLATEIRERLPGEPNGFHREHAARLFLALDGNHLDDEEFLEFCRANGLPLERLERLLDLRRSEEAAWEIPTTG